MMVGALVRGLAPPGYLPASLQDAACAKIVAKTKDSTPHTFAHETFGLGPGHRKIVCRTTRSSQSAKSDAVVRTAKLSKE
jgi:hypothetical protein